MTDSQLAILVNGLPAFIGAIFAGFALLQSRKNGQQVQTVDDKVTDNTAKTEAVSGQVAVLHESTNGKMEALIKATGAAEHAAGKEEERVEERGRVAAAGNAVTT